VPCVFDICFTNFQRKRSFCPTRRRKTANSSPRPMACNDRHAFCIDECRRLKPPHSREHGTARLALKRRHTLEISNETFFVTRVRALSPVSRYAVRRQRIHASLELRCPPWWIRRVYLPHRNLARTQLKHFRSPIRAPGRDWRVSLLTRFGQTNDALHIRCPRTFIDPDVHR
jgi:hypothetical protein